ncbi:HEAT repeat domain-containing protein [Luteolibacter algae]|uniref:HEAT repeat domain-containing protein n=1 Tax=Luteolibacter algae TaxID=454151 RepID=A0ABW5D8C9_9BACT
MKKSPVHLSTVLWLAIASGSAHGAFQSFEGDGYGDWAVSGEAFGASPVHGTIDGLDGSFSTFSGDSFAASVYGDESATGTLTSPEFKISKDYIWFLVAGGDSAGKTAIQLLIDGKVEYETTGKRSLRFEGVRWDVRRFMGKKAVIRLVDDATGPWGFIAADEITMTNGMRLDFPPPTRNGEVFVEGLVPTPELPGATIPEGSTLKIEATSEEHGIASPTAISVDEKGGVFVAETHRLRHGVGDDRDSLYWYLEDLRAQTTDDRREMYKRHEDKFSHEFMTEKSEILRHISDTNGDGKMDSSKVFADGFNDELDGVASGVFAFDGAVYFACIPKVYNLLDKDSDGVADERKIIADGMGVRVSFSGHDMNGFALGPDGRVYGTIGDRGFSFTTKEGEKLHHPNEGAAFRFDLDGSNFELFHIGLRNPKEIAFDRFGNAFSVDNNSDQGDSARVVYLVEGGNSGWQMENQTMHSFHRQIGLENRPPNRWMDEKMWELENDSQPAYIVPPVALLTSGPSGLTYHPGTGFLESEKDRFLVCDYRGSSAKSSIWSFGMEPKGAGMQIAQPRQFARGIAATDLEYSFDGRLFISDYVTGWTSHDDGRLLSLNAGENLYLPEETADTAKTISGNFDERTSEALAALLSHPDSRIRLRAQIALTRKADAVATFEKALASEDQMTRIHSVWGLGIIARRGFAPSATDDFSPIPPKGLREEAAGKLIPLLEDPDPEIRFQTARAISEAPISGDSLPLGKLLNDQSSRVRSAAAIAIGRMKAIGQYSAILDLLRKNNGRDVYLRHAGIYALEHIVSSPRQISPLYTDPSPAVRVAAVVALRRMKSEEVARFVNDEDPKVQNEAIRAIYDNDHKQMLGMVAALLDDLDSREWSPFMLRRLVHSAYRSGGEENAKRLMNVLANDKLPEEVRAEALRLLQEWEKPFPADQLTGHWRPLEPRSAETIKPVLAEAMPVLLKNDGMVLEGALGLIEQYHIDVAALDGKTLKALFENPELPPATRAGALTLYIERDEADLTSVLKELAISKDDAIALTALKSLAERSPQAAIPALRAAVSSDSASRVQKAWPVISSIPGDETAGIIASGLKSLIELEGISPGAIELLEAAKTRKEPMVAKALAEFEKAVSESQDPLAKFNIALEGGNPENGASLFNSHPSGQCLRCHKADDKVHSAGGDAGPNLAGIATRHERRYFLESMILPAAVVAPGYGITSVTFKNGASLAGNFIEETPEEITISTPEKTYRIKRSDIESFSPPVSAMPPMDQLLSPTEIRDLVAWLGSLDKAKKATKGPQAELLDPATLPGAKPQSSNEAKDQTLIPISTAGQENGGEPVVKSKESEAKAIDDEKANAEASSEEMKLGKQQFAICAACHGQSGEGTAAGPPLAGSEWVNGPAENLILIQLRGLVGPITVKGQNYSFPAGMTPLAYQNDQQIAAVLTYIRSSFGNNAPPVSPEEVAALRKENEGKPQLQASDLIEPEPYGTAPAPEDIGKEAPSKYDDLKTSSGLPGWILVALPLFVIGCLVAGLRRK